MELDRVLAYCDEKFPDFIEDLKELVKIPSVSFPGFPGEKMHDSALGVKVALEKAGLQNVEILELPEVHPYVFGEYIVSPDAPTLLLYAHHDVQPPMREQLWRTPAFEATEVDGRLYGRGAADDKGGIIVHTAAIECYLKTAATLPLNVKVIIEGEEECGSEHLFEFISRYKSKLQADALVMTDGANYDTGVPAITTSLRGVCILDCTVSALDHPLHSGLWGGPLPDPIMALSRLLSSLVDEKGELSVPGLCETIIEPGEEELQGFASLGFTDEVFRKQSGILDGVELLGANKSIPYRLWRKPSLVINAIESGDRKNAGSVVMDSAWARLGIRIVPGMDEKKSMQILKEHLQKNAPWGVKVDLKEKGFCGAWVCPLAEHQEFFSSSKEALSKGFDRDAVYIGCGASIPFVEPFSKALGGVPALLVGVEDPYTNAHGENESLHLGDFKKAIKSEIHLFNLLAQTMKK
ncbi:M20/M25/M40 family metallo-hydrolase [Candidatus Riflebacteria bacterium]